MVAIPIFGWGSEPVDFKLSMLIVWKLMFCFLICLYIMATINMSLSSNCHGFCVDRSDDSANHRQVGCCLYKRRLKLVCPVLKLEAVMNPGEKILMFIFVL